MTRVSVRNATKNKISGGYEMSAGTVLEKLKNKKVNKKDLIIVILLFIIAALIFFGWNYFRTKQNPINIDIAPADIKHNYLFSIYEPGVLSRPLGVAVSQWGDIVVADSANHRIAIFDANGKLSKTLGKMGQGPGEFNYPTGVAVYGGKIYVADFYNQRVQVLDFDGEQLSVLPRGLDLKEIGSGIMPVTLAVDKNGNLYVSDVSQQRILVFDDKGNFTRFIGQGGSGAGQLSYVNGIAVNVDDGEVYLSNSNNSRIDVFDLEGRYTGQRLGPTQVVNPKGIVFEESTGLLYVADTLAHRILVVNREGKIVEYIGRRGLDSGQFNFPTAVTIDEGGRLYVADRENDRIQVFGR